jgi:hypothetical protein
MAVRSVPGADAFLSPVEKAKRARERSTPDFAWASRYAGPMPQPGSEMDRLMPAGQRSALHALAADREDTAARDRYIYDTIDAEQSAAMRTPGSGRMTGMWGDYFDTMRANELAANWAGKNFQVDTNAWGNTPSPSNDHEQGGRMPRQDPMGGLMRAVQGGGGGIEIPAGAQAEIGRLLGRRMMDDLQPRPTDDQEFEMGLYRDRRATQFGADTDRAMRPYRDDRATEDAQRSLDLTNQFGVPMAHAEANVGDVMSERGAARHFMPWQAGKNADVANTTLERVIQQFVRPAELDVERAGITARGNVDTALAQQSGAGNRDALETLQKLVTGGMGYEGGEETMAPFMGELQRRLLPGGGMGGAATPGGAPTSGPGAGGSAGPFTPQQEQMIQQGIGADFNGRPATRDDVITFLRGRGLLR